VIRGDADRSRLQTSKGIARGRPDAQLFYNAPKLPFSSLDSEAFSSEKLDLTKSVQFRSKLRHYLKLWFTLRRRTTLLPRSFRPRVARLSHGNSFFAENRPGSSRVAYSSRSAFRDRNVPSRSYASRSSYEHGLKSQLNVVPELRPSVDRSLRVRRPARLSRRKGRRWLRRQRRNKASRRRKTPRLKPVHRFFPAHLQRDLRTLRAVRVQSPTVEDTHYSFRGSIAKIQTFYRSKGFLKKLIA
jgi:hypothetical protein